MQEHLWIVYAILAALCAAMINILGKIGLKGVNSDLATAMRSVVQAAFVVSFAALAGVFKHATALQGNTKAYLSIIAAGVLGGLSWIFVFRALTLADNSKVSPIDKLSMPIGILLAVLILGERPTVKNWAGIGLIVVGAYLASAGKAKT
ncbi:EamA family transporter [soil metagenome]